MVRVLKQGINDLATLFPEVAKEAYGWSLIQIAGPMPGHLVADVELKIKKWLKKSNPRIDGSHESWRKKDYYAVSLQNIALTAGVDAADSYWLN